MGLSFHTLNVFTEDRFGGNPLAVVLGADNLDSATMQSIARDFNLSETVFVQTPDNPAHSAKIRIFTPAAELPFAGHPTVGTAILLADRRSKETGGTQEQLVALEEKIGLVRVGVRRRADGAAFAEFDGPKMPEPIGGVPHREAIASAVGLIPAEIGYANHEPTIYDAGAKFLFVPVASRQALATATANMTRWSQDLGGSDGVGVFLYTNQADHHSKHFAARLFAPAHGIPEDPATGSAAAAFAGVVHRFDGLPDGTHRREVEQGYDMGRPSVISLSIEVAGGGLTGVRIGGYAVDVSRGVLEI